MDDYVPHPGLRAKRPGVIDLRSMTPGTHLCAFYQDEAELSRGAEAFVAAGLSAGDRVLYVAAGRPLPAVRESLAGAGIPVTTAVASSQLVLRSFGEMYGGGQGTDLAEVDRGYRALASQTRADGFPALRVAAEMGDFTRFLGSVDHVLAWEQMATRLQHDEGISSVCQYDRRSLPAAGAALIGAEHAGVAPDSVPPALVSYLAMSPAPGLAITGELDVASRAEFARVLRAKLAVFPRLRLEVKDLTFVDLSIARELYCAADELPADGLITVTNASRILGRLIELAGLQHPRLVIHGPEAA